MLHRLRLIFVGVLLCAYGSRPAAAQIPSPTETDVVANNSTADIQKILSRLDQQEAEIRALRQQLGAPSDTAIQPLPPLDAMPGTVEEIPPPITPATPYEVGSELAMSASWQSGLVFNTPNRDFRIHIGGLTQFDLSAFNNDPALTVSPAVGGIGPQPDSVQLRRGRLRIDGTMYETFDFAAEYDFVQTLAPTLPEVGVPSAAVPSICDLWITCTQLPAIGNFRVGNMKEPIGMEHMQNCAWLDFLERSYLQDIVFGPYNNEFNPGLMCFNWWGEERGTWWLGGFANNNNPFGYGIGDDWAVTGRVTWLPYYDEPSCGRYLWHWGVAGSVRNPTDDIARLRTRGDIHSGPPGVLNPIYADTGTLQASQQELIQAETAAVLGSWTIQGEYLCTWLENAVQPFAPVPVNHGSPLFHGGYVQVLYFLTGEHRAYDRHLGAFGRVVPHTNAFFVDSSGGHCCGWGAWQIGARYNAIDLNDNGINGGILQSGTFTVNWWLNPNAHVQFNYDLTHRSQVDETPQGFINAYGMRFAYDF